MKVCQSREGEASNFRKFLCFSADNFMKGTSVNSFPHVVPLHVMKYRQHEKPGCVSALLSVINDSSGLVERRPYIITIPAGPLLLYQEGENELLMFDLKHNIFSLTVTATNSFICSSLPPDETII